MIVFLVGERLLQLRAVILAIGCLSSDLHYLCDEFSFLVERTQVGEVNIELSIGFGMGDLLLKNVWRHSLRL